MGSPVGRHLTHREPHLTQRAIMRMLRTIRLRLRSLFRPGHVERELDDELRGHLERQIEAHRAAGLTAEAARAAALREFGNVPLVQEQVRDTRGVSWLEDLVRDGRYALRSLRRARGYAVAAMASLALGIGANTAIFSLIDDVMVEKLPVDDPNRLFFIDNSDGKSGGRSAPPYPGFELMREGNRFMAGMAAFDENQFKVTIDGAPESVRGQYASGNFFEVLGVRALHGRTFTPADDSVFERGGPEGAVAVISHGFWRRRFGMDPAVLGRTIQVGTSLATIVGITPPEFTGLQTGSPIDVTIPMMLAGRSVRARELWWFSAVGRLKPDATVEQARADLEVLWDAYMVDIGQPRERRNPYFSGIALVPAAKGLDGVRRQFSQPLLILMGIVLTVLLIGCANVANLLLARASARWNEIAVRLSLGASRARVVRQLVTEGAVLVVLGTVAGLAFARWGVSFLTRMLAPGGSGIVLTPEFNWRVLLFTAVVAALTTLLFSLAPALHATRVDAAKPSATGVTPSARPLRLRQTLLVVQVTLSVALLCAAGLFVRTLANLYDFDTGFESAGVLTMEIGATLPTVNVPPRTPERREMHARVGAMWEEAIARVRELPGVVTAGAGGMSPLTGRDRGVLIQWFGGPPVPQEDREIHINQVTSGFVETMGIELLAGRGLTDRDRGGAPRVALLNETAAGVYFGSRQAALRRQIWFPGQTVEEPYEVVGVVRDVRYVDLRTPDEPMAYLPIEQSLEPMTSAVVVVRAQGDVSAVVSSARDAARRALPGGFALRVASMEERVDASLLRERLLSLLATFFGGLALALAWIGLYGVMTYAVVRRTREIATHVAIGAPQASIIWMIVREMMAVVAIGAVLGAAAALLAGRYLRTQLFDVAPADPAAVAAAVLLLLVVAVAAAYRPARRAARIDPVVALRME